MRRVVILPTADRDLDEQALYYLERGAPKTARRWYDQAAVTFEFLARQLEIRAQTPWEALRGIRSWPVSGFDRHDVFYRPLEERIEVVRILHGVRDINAILGDS
jgi:toxin ParE1/3/4